MQFTRENRQDIHKYYVHTYVKFKAHAIEKSLNADTLFYIEAVDDSKVSGKCENGDPFVIWLSDTHPFEVDYVLPHKSFFQYHQNAVLLERVPAQQYFRGLCPENTRMTFLGTTSTPKKHTIGFDTLKLFVTKQSFFSLQSAISAENCTTCVLSPRMQYHRGNRNIYIDHMPIATVYPKERQITLKTPIFREEIEELLKANDEFHTFLIIERKTEKELEVQL